MFKLWVLARKEVTLAFRDLSGLILMLITPFLLTLAVAAAFGSESNAALQELPVLIYNPDPGAMGEALVAALQPEESGGYLVPVVVPDLAEARAAIDADEAVALIVIPEDLTARLGEGPAAGEPVVVEIYASPMQPVGVSVVQAIVSQYLAQVNLHVGGTQRLVVWLAEQGGAEPVSVTEIEAAVSAGIAEAAEPTGLGVRLISTTGRAFSWLNYFAPSLALLFLMFVATGGGRTILAEMQQGTLPRLLVSPTPQPLILLGKMAGAIVTGLLQMFVLWGATSLVGAEWGDPFAVTVSIVVLVLCTSGLGALIAAVAQTTVQANMLSAVIAMVAAALSGNFSPRTNLPAWSRTLSLVTPNGWGLEMFTQMQTGAGLPDLWPLLGGVLLLTGVYYGLALWLLQRRFA